MMETIRPILADEIVIHDGDFIVTWVDVDMKMMLWGWYAVVSLGEVLSLLCQVSSNAITKCLIAKNNTLQESTS